MVVLFKENSTSIKCDKLFILRKENFLKSSVPMLEYKKIYIMQDDVFWVDF